MSSLVMRMQPDEMAWPIYSGWLGTVDAVQGVLVALVKVERPRAQRINRTSGNALRRICRLPSTMPAPGNTFRKPTPKADSVVALIDHSNLISHFSIDGRIASSRAFGTASINSASASLKPEAA